MSEHGTKDNVYNSLVEVRHVVGVLVLRSGAGASAGKEETGDEAENERANAAGGDGH